MDIHILPEELWSHIAELLSSTAPSLRKIRDEPNLSLTRSFDCPLKNLSLVCAKLRRITLPILFRCTCLRIVCPIEQDRSQQHANLAGAPFESLSGSQQINNTAWIPQLQSRHRAFLEFVHSEGLARAIHSFVLICDHPTKELPAAALDQAICDEQTQGVIATFWKEIIATLDLMRIVIVAPPRDLVKLTSAKLGLFNEWVFSDMDLHVLEVSNPDITWLLMQQNEMPEFRGGKEDISGFAPDSILKLRKWQQLGLNEGSFLRGYGCYEYFEHGAPSSVLSIKDCLTTEFQNRLAESVSMGKKSQLDFTYTAIFPFASHANFNTLLKSSEQFDVQLAPNSRSRSFKEQEQVGNMDLQDCWWELLEAYHNLADTVRTFDHMSEKNFPCLNKILSQDFAISALREELDNACTPLCLPVWAEYRPGVFTRLAKSARDLN